MQRLLNQVPINNISARAYIDTSGISIFALGRQQVPGCWRCGDKNHLRRDCTLPASKAELEGAPMNQWAKMPRVASSVVPPQAPFPSAARGPATSATTVLAQMAALNVRIDRQDTMFETILQRLPPLTPLPGVPMAALLLRWRCLRRPWRQLP